MTDQEKEKIALFRYGIISPVVSNIAISMSKKEFFKQLIVAEIVKSFAFPRISSSKW